MPNIRLVVFDMAGTTINEDNLVYKTVQLALKRAGYPVPLEKVLLMAAGKEKLQAITDVLTDVVGAQKAAMENLPIFEDFKALLVGAYARNTVKPMPGAEEVFKKLKEKGIQVVLNTGYNLETANSLLQQLGWLDHPAIDFVFTASDVTHGRPHPEMIHLAMQKCGLTDAGVVAKVGDSIVDIEEGLNAGCGLVAGITTGAQTREQLWSAKPSCVVDSLDELISMIEENHAVEV